MPLALAERSELIAPSATLAMGAEARRLKAKGIEILDLRWVSLISTPQ